MTERETKFKGFANLLLEDIQDDLIIVAISDDRTKTIQAIDDIGRIIAQRAYDLMAHIIDNAPASVSDADDWNISDLTQWPPTE